MTMPNKTPLNASTGMGEAELESENTFSKSGGKASSQPHLESGHINPDADPGKPKNLDSVTTGSDSTILKQDELDRADISVRLVGKSPKRDPWDKLDIIARILSSVLLAGVALLINSSIQRNQIASSEASSRAQMEAAKAQAQDQKKLQEGTLTAQLVQHLASTNPTEREISIIALRQSVPPQIYDATLLVLARADPSKDVRLRAIENLSSFPTVSVTKSLSNIASDMNRPADERKAAEESARMTAIGQFLTGNREVVFAASTLSTSAIDGVFTKFLLKGLQGEADSTGDGVIDSDELRKYLAETVSRSTEGKQIPYVTSTGNTPIPLNRPQDSKSKIVVIGIGISSYSDPAIPRLAYGIADARGVVELYKSRAGAATLILTDLGATRAGILRGIQQATQMLAPDDTLIFYYGGMGWLIGGESMLVPYDARPNERSSFVSVAEVRAILENVKTKVLYLDTSFATSPFETLQ